MSNKYKMTGCARFFVFLLFIVPIAYFGAKYVQEKGLLDGLQEKVGQNNDSSGGFEDVIDVNTSSSDNADISQLKKKMQELISAARDQQKTITTQERIIEEQKATIQQLRSQLATATGSQQPSPTNETKSNNKGTDLEELLNEADEALRKNRNN